MNAVFSKRILIIITAYAVLSLLEPTAVAADIAGQTKTFFVSSKYDEFNRTALSATLRFVSERAYFYVDNQYWDDRLSGVQRDVMAVELEKLGREFDDKIFPGEHTFWGYEINPQTYTGDPRLTILLESLKPGTGGYFETDNSYPVAQSPRSNERDMLVVSANSLGGEQIKIFIGHELQHLLSFNQKEIKNNHSEETWLNELRSEYAATLLGYNAAYTGSSLAQRVRTFMESPPDSLTEWNNTTVDYGVVALFSEYLVGRFGPSIVSQTIKNTLTGSRSLGDYLTRQSPPTTFVQVFIDWLVASYLNDKTLGVRYGYANPDLKTMKLAPLRQSDLVRGVTVLVVATVKGWQPSWLEFNVPGGISGSNEGLRFDISAEPGQIFALGMIVSYDDGSREVKDVRYISGEKKMLWFNPAVADGIAGKKITQISFAVTNVIDETTIKDIGYTSHQFSVSASFTDKKTAQDMADSAPNEVISSIPGHITDGVLIKRIGKETEMYVITGKYKRYLRPEVIAMYGHLDPAKVIEAADTAFNSYPTANYVRSVNDKKVYAVWPDGTKHWLNMTADYFTSSGRDWNAIFIINDTELNYYKTGADVTR